MGMKKAALYESPAELCADDDFLANILLDTLALPGHTRLGVHYASADSTVSDYERSEIQDIVTEYVCKRASAPRALVHLLETPPFRRYVASLGSTSASADHRFKAFNTHALYYLHLYLPLTSVEIGPTTRYTKVTRKNELAVFATAPIPRWTVLKDHLAGNTAPLERDEEDELTGRDSDMNHSHTAFLPLAQQAPSTANPGGRLAVNGGRAQKDFSIVFNEKRKLNDLFLGPARFLNHDCDPNCELTRQTFKGGTCISFRTRRAIRPGEELTAFYAKSYFGEGNSECMCATCESRGQGYYTHRPQQLHSSGPPTPCTESDQFAIDLSSPEPPPASSRGSGKPSKATAVAADGPVAGRPKPSRSTTPEVASPDGVDDLAVSLLLTEEAEYESCSRPRRRKPTGSPWCPGDGASGTRSSLSRPPPPRTAAKAVGQKMATTLATLRDTGRCDRCKGILTLTAPVNGHVVPECTRCWRHRVLHGALWPIKPASSSTLVGSIATEDRKGPGPITDTENGTFYGPEWAASDEPSSSDEDDKGGVRSCGGGGRFAVGMVDSADELEAAAVERKRKAREWDADVFEILEKADYKHGLTFCYCRVRGVTLSRTLDAQSLPIVNLSAILRVRPLAGVKEGPELRGALFVDPPESATPTVRYRWIHKGVWVQLDYAVQIARERGLAALLERFLERTPQLGWPDNFNPTQGRVAAASASWVRRQVGQALASTPSVSSRAPSIETDAEEVDPCVGIPVGLDEQPLPRPPKSEYPVRDKVTLPPAQSAVRGTTAPELFIVDFPIQRRFYQCEPSRTVQGGSNLVVVVQREFFSHWLNLTAILRLAGLDRAQRSRVFAALKARDKWLYGSIDGQGTWEGVWTPLAKGRELARRYGVDRLLHPAFLLDKREFFDAFDADVPAVLVDMQGIPLADQSRPVDEDEDEDGMDADDESDSDDRPLAKLLSAKLEVVEVDEDSDDEVPLRQVLSAKGSIASTACASTAGATLSPAGQVKQVASPTVPVAPLAVARPTPPTATAARVPTKRIRLTLKDPLTATSSTASSLTSSNVAPAQVDTVHSSRNKPIPYAQPGPAVARWPNLPAKPAGRYVPSFKRINPVKAEQIRPSARVPTAAPAQVMNFRKIQRPPLPRSVHSSPAVGPGSIGNAASSAVAPAPNVIRSLAAPVKLEASSSDSIQFLGEHTAGTYDTPIDLCDSSADETPAEALTVHSRLDNRSLIKRTLAQRSPTKIRAAPKYLASARPLAPTPSDAFALSAVNTGKSRARIVGPSDHISHSFGAASVAINRATAAAVESEALRQLGLSADDDDDEEDEPVLVHMARVPIELSDGDDDDSETPICTGRTRTPRTPRRSTLTLTGGGADSPIEID